MAEARKRFSPPSMYQEMTQPVTSEGDLRRRAINAIKQTPSHRFSSLTALYGQFDIFPREEELKKLLLAGLNTAKRDITWGATPTTVNLGYYSGDLTFFTYYFHEAAHLTLSQLGRDHTTYEQNPKPEEEFCWKASKIINSIVGLPFSQEQADLSLQTLELLEQITQTGANPKFLSQLYALIQDEENRIGFSSYSQHLVRWTPQGKPKIKPFS